MQNLFASSCTIQTFYSVVYLQFLSVRPEQGILQETLCP